MEWIINNRKYGTPDVNEYEGWTIFLKTKEELHAIQNETPLALMINIFGGVEHAKDADDDTRGGFTDYGLLSEVVEPDADIPGDFGTHQYHDIG